MRAMQSPNPNPQNEAWREERNLRRLQTMVHLVVAAILQDRSLTVEQASQMAAHARDAALRMFPDKEATYTMLCRPRIQRAMRERFGLQ